MNVGDGSLAPVLTLETMQLVFESSSIMLDECHYCPSFLMNVISIGLLAKLDFKFLLKDNFCDFIMNDAKIIWGQLKYDIYLLSQPVSIMYTSSKHPKLDNVGDTYL